MSHSHHHHHANIGEGGLEERPLAIAFAINVGLTLVQIVAGLVSGSLSLVADALHNLSDAAALGVALGARRIAQRPADNLRTFGYRRAEILGALINVTALLLMGLFLAYEAVKRIFDPHPIEGWIVIVVAGVALVVDLATAWLTYRLSKDSMNIRAAFIHNMADALGSVAVIVAGTLILLFDFYLADTIATLFIAAYMVYHGATMINEAVHILMEGVPADVELDKLSAAMQGIEGVCDVHHVHAWHLDERHRALEAHVVIREEDLAKMGSIKRALKELLAREYQIQHSTLEFEGSADLKNHSCDEEAHEVGVKAEG